MTNIDGVSLIMKVIVATLLVLSVLTSQIAISVATEAREVLRVSLPLYTDLSYDYWLDCARKERGRNIERAY